MLQTKYVNLMRHRLHKT